MHRKVLLQVSLCNKETAQGKKYPLMEVFCSKAPSRGLWMPELVLYGIRELAIAIPRKCPRHRGGPLCYINPAHSLVGLVTSVILPSVAECCSVWLLCHCCHTETLAPSLSPDEAKYQTLQINDFLPPGLALLYNNPQQKKIERKNIYISSFYHIQM